MFLRILFAGLHLLALGVGLGAVWGRRQALRGPLDDAGVGRVLRTDAWWGVAGGLWLVTGLVRLFAPLEKGSAYYFGNHLFLTKMALFIAIVALEVKAIRTLGGWRAARRRGSGSTPGAPEASDAADALQTPEAAEAATLARISGIQAGLVVLMVFLAVAMARGIGVV